MSKHNIYKIDLNCTFDCILYRKIFTGNWCDGECKHNKFTMKFIHYFDATFSVSKTIFNKFCDFFSSKTNFHNHMKRKFFGCFFVIERKSFSQYFLFLFFLLFLCSLYGTDIAFLAPKLHTFADFSIHVTFATRSTADWIDLICLIIFFNKTKRKTQFKVCNRAKREARKREMLIFLLYEADCKRGEMVKKKMLKTKLSIMFAFVGR